MGSHSHREVEGVVAGGVGGGEGTLWYRHRSYNPYRAKVQDPRQRQRQVEEDLEAEEGRGEARRRGSLSVLLQVGVSLADS